MSSKLRLTLNFELITHNLSGTLVERCMLDKEIASGGIHYFCSILCRAKTSCINVRIATIIPVDAETAPLRGNGPIVGARLPRPTGNVERVECVRPIQNLPFHNFPADYNDNPQEMTVGRKDHL